MNKKPPKKFALFQKERKLVKQMSMDIHSHNVYCYLCGKELEIMKDLRTVLYVYPCGCGQK